MTRFSFNAAAIKSRLFNYLAFTGDTPGGPGKQSTSRPPEARPSADASPAGPGGGGDVALCRQPALPEGQVDALLAIPGVEAFIAQAYRELLGREPDWKGATRYAWLLHHVPFYTRRRFLKNILGSEEYRRRHNIMPQRPGDHYQQLWAELEQRRRHFEKQYNSFVEQRKELEQQRLALEYQRFLFKQQQNGLDWQRRQFEQERVAFEQQRQRLEEALDLQRRELEPQARPDPQTLDLAQQDPLTRPVVPQLLKQPEPNESSGEPILRYAGTQQDRGLETDREAS